MTALLQQAFAEAAKLSEAEQDLLSSRLLTEQPPPCPADSAQKRPDIWPLRRVDAWVAGVEKALEDEANNPKRDPKMPPITKTQMVNKHGKRAFEGYNWNEPPQSQQTNP